MIKTHGEARTEEYKFISLYVYISKVSTNENLCTHFERFEWPDVGSKCFSL